MHFATYNLTRIPRMKRHPASSANPFRSLYQALTMDQMAEFRRTRRVKEEIGSFASISAAFGSADPIYLLVWTAPDGIKRARMRSLEISDKGDRPWNRLSELVWTRRNTFSSFME